MRRTTLLVLVAGLVMGSTYDRREWPHWVDADGDCQDTRQEVLIRDSLTAPEYEDEDQCEVVLGTWVDPYSGQVYHDPADVHIDHIVSLNEAHQGRRWPSLEERKLFANWMPNLQVAGARENQAKGRNPPHRWMPKVNPCEYLLKRVYVQEHWGIRPSWPEARYAVERLAACRVERPDLFPRTGLGGWD